MQITITIGQDLINVIMMIVVGIFILYDLALVKHIVESYKRYDKEWKFHDKANKGNTEVGRLTYIFRKRLLVSLQKTFIFLFNGLLFAGLYLIFLMDVFLFITIGFFILTIISKINDWNRKRKWRKELEKYEDNENEDDDYW